MSRELNANTFPRLRKKDSFLVLFPAVAKKFCCFFFSSPCLCQETFLENLHMDITHLKWKRTYGSSEMFCWYWHNSKKASGINEKQWLRFPKVCGYSWLFSL